ncbi:MAG: aminotransferase class I/II-fold pyridoxal phosphate-dependent enzyme [Gemmatimonadetes bacterium]|nr:aminotransferase class I/II-fold pyridoxal phosphate-dependent enzyme [Gemmatimonadota bacterium]MYH54064.1 aminotransferase class I/II-fold pyridoxal phosphate-dependent enzyme [Gemmatimonadota bacterium]MYK66053.1 aminotransferase class I/II-fold pyridoxal phosphate-dependent enzyme [Gemmatimonadota bacterium]
MIQRTAVRTHTFTESVIRHMTRVARRHGAINLAQGFPDFPAPRLLKDAACRAIQDDVNQYAITWGTPALRTALAAKYAEWYGLEVDAESEITVTCGATEAMAAVMLAAIDPGEEVVVFEPFYENYGPDAVLCDAAPVFVPLSPPDFRLDPDRLADAVTKRTRAIVVNTPNNPSGRVLDRDELGAVARICKEHDILAITDEIYEHIVYDGEHIPLATLPGMRDRTVVISGASKTFSVTGWRIGTIVAPAWLNSAIRKVHDFLTVGAPAPLQDACAAGLESLGADYYEGLARDYRERRDILFQGLQDAGFRCRRPEGAYYIMADFSPLSSLDDTAFSTFLARECGIAPVPGSSFYHRPEDGRKLVRFAFCKRIGTLEGAVSRLRGFFA